MLPGGRQAASDLQGMNGKTDNDQFAAESERVSLADFSGQEHRWNCPKANRIDDTNGNRNGCMQLSFQSARKCLKTIPVQQKTGDEESCDVQKKYRRTNNLYRRYFYDSISSGLAIILLRDC